MKLKEFVDLFGFSAAQFNSWKEGNAIKSNKEISQNLQFLTKIIKTLSKEKVLKILSRKTLNLNYKEVEDNFGIIYTKIYRWNKKRAIEIADKENNKPEDEKKHRNFNIEKKLRLIEFLQKLEPEEIECLKNILMD